MQLINTFTVSTPVERTWAEISDLRRIAGCVTDLALSGGHGDDGFGWSSSVKVGSVDAQLKGTAHLVDRDDTRHHAVLSAHASDTRGGGDLAATVDLQVRSRGTGSEVVVGTDLQLTGRMARVGSGVVAGVSGKLIGQVARQLEAQLSAETGPLRGPTAEDTEKTVPITGESADNPDLTRDDNGDVRPSAARATGASLNRFGYVLASATGLLGLIVGLLLGRRAGHRVRSGSS